MKKLVYLIVAIVVLGLIVSGCIPVVPPVEKAETTSLTKAKPDNDGLQPGLDFNGPHYNLNLIGKKADWSGGGSYDNPDRHTIFVPEDTTGWTIETPGDEDTTNVPDLDGIRIWMTQGPEFAVIDGNACNDGEAAFELGPGTYRVYIVAKAKPAKKDEPEYYTDITGWVYAKDEFGGAYYFDVGFVKVTKSKKWKDATDLFYVSPGEDYFGIISEDMWVFEYLSFLTAYDFGEDPDITDAAYFWQFDNHGNKLVKVRFYPVEK